MGGAADYTARRSAYRDPNAYEYHHADIHSYGNLYGDGYANFHSHTHRNAHSYYRAVDYLIAFINSSYAPSGDSLPKDTSSRCLSGERHCVRRVIYPQISQITQKDLKNLRHPRMRFVKLRIADVKRCSIREKEGAL